MRVLSVQAACAVMLLAAWTLDLVSPQLFVAAVLLTAPVALSGFALRPRYTASLIGFALAADMSAGWFNAYHDGFRWEPFAVGDRLLAAFAVVLVGVLTLNVQKTTLRAAGLSDRNARSETIRDVIYALSHDLRTPIMASRMTMHQALDGAYGTLPDAYRAILQSSIASNEELHRLAETLLLVARYESGEQSVIREEVDVREAAHTVVRELESLAQVKHVDIHFKGDATPVYVLGDASELKRAMTNFVANAVTWTPQHGHIWIDVDAVGSEAHFRVRDDGYGVAPEAVPQLFERFSGRARAGAGLGLGLYIVRRIAEAHGGSVHYEPARPQGSSFSFTLPLYDRSRGI